MTAPSPIPASVRDDVSGLISNLPVATRWTVRRAIERAYAAGYADGHSVGDWEAHRDARDTQRQAQ